jgi:hypothetical protein
MMNHSLVTEQPTTLINANLQLPAGLGTSGSAGSTFTENWNVKLGDILRPLLSSAWLP